MSFANPLGLLLLLGIPVVVAIHLLKPRAKEAIVSSLFLWKRSVSYQKRRRRSHQQRLLTLILQVFVIIVISLISAVPTLMLPVSVSSRIVILDASASMNAAYNEHLTRFEHAKALIIEQMRRQSLGVETTVLLAAPEMMVLAEKAVSAAELERALSDAYCGWETDCFDDALTYAQQLLRKGQHAEVVLYTDADYPAAENITIRNVAGEQNWNAAITYAEASIHEKGASITADVLSYGRNAELTLALYVDDVLQSAQIVACTQDEPFQTHWTISDETAFEQLRISIVEAEDALAADNDWIIARNASERINVLLAGDNSVFMTGALEAFERVDVHSVSGVPATLPDGYDLYVLEGGVPQQLPEASAVWMLHPPKHAEALTPLGLSLGELLQGSRLSMAEQLSSSATILQENLGLAPLAVQQFREILTSGDMEPVMMCGFYPVLLAGQSNSGARYLVLTFDLRRSNLPMHSEFIFLIDNMLRYTSPQMMTRCSYTTSDTAEAVILPTCQEMQLTLPDGTINRLSPIGDHIAIDLTQPGTYTLVQHCANRIRQSSFFVTLPESEQHTTLSVKEEPLAVNQTAAQAKEAIPYDPRTLLTVMLMMLLILESGVYHHEQL